MAKDRFDIKEKEGVSFMTDAIVIVDKETGVNYLTIKTSFWAHWMAFLYMWAFLKNSLLFQGLFLNLSPNNWH